MALIRARYIERIGSLGDIAFEASPFKMKPLNGLEWGGSVRYGEHDIHLGNQLLEYEGMDADTFKLEIILSKFLGIDPIDSIAKIFEYERDGTALPLILGNKAYGKYKWVIKDHTTDMEVFDRKGNLVRATVHLNLLGYVNGG